MTTPLETRTLQRRDMPGSRIGEDVVIFDDRVGKYYATGPVGAEIWEMLAEPTSLDAICDRLTQSYSIDTATCRSQTREFIAYLDQLNLLEPVAAFASQP